MCTVAIATTQSVWICTNFLQSGEELNITHPHLHYSDVTCFILVICLMSIISVLAQSPSE